MRKVVMDGYNQMAKAYLTERKKLRTGKYLQKLLERLTPDAVVLDLGCGAGVGVDDVIIKSGRGVIGIDIAENQIRLARQYCRGGDFRVGDLAEIKQGEYQVEAVVCMFSLFHLPRTEHLYMLRKMRSLVGEGGWLLITMGDQDFEGEHPMLGVKMWSSQYGPARNLALLKEAGWRVVEQELNTTGNEKHLVVLAQRA